MVPIDTNPYKEGGVIDLLPFIKKLHNITDSKDVKHLYYVITKYIKDENDENENSVVLIFIDEDSKEKTIDLIINDSSIHSQFFQKQNDLKDKSDTLSKKEEKLARIQEFLSFINKLNNVPLNKGGHRYDEFYPSQKKNSNSSSLTESYYGINDKILEESKSNIQKLKDKIDNCLNSSFNDTDKKELNDLFNTAKTEDEVKTNTLIQWTQKNINELDFVKELNTEISNLKNTNSLKDEIKTLETKIQNLKTDNPLLHLFSFKTPILYESS